MAARGFRCSGQRTIAPPVADSHWSIFIRGSVLSVKNRRHTDDVRNKLEIDLCSRNVSRAGRFFKESPQGMF